VQLFSTLSACCPIIVSTVNIIFVKVKMRGLKFFTLITLSTLLLTGCGSIQSEITVNNDGNVEELILDSRFDKKIFNEYVNTNFVFTPPPSNFYETHPSIKENMSEGLKKFGIFFENQIFESLNLETIVPENLTIKYLQSICSYSEDIFFYYAECEAKIPFFVNLPLTGTVLQGETKVDENLKQITHTGLLNSFVSVPNEFYFANSFNLIFTFRFAENVVNASGEGVAFKENIVVIDAIQLQQASLTNNTPPTVTVIVGWSEIKPFWQQLWFRVLMSLLGFILVTRFVLKMFTKFKQPPKVVR
jgi:hypothetical protein